MTDKDSGGPAFPFYIPDTREYHGEGMTLRQYAAIKLGVPDSGTDWLDAMIRKSNRDKLAMAAMQGLMASSVEASMPVFAKQSYRMSDEMLEAGE